MFLKVLVGILALTAYSAHAQVPNTFQSGQPARASEVNQNFSFLNNKVESSISEVSIILRGGQGLSGADGFDEAVCPSGTVPTSASCICDGDGGTRNFGTLIACGITETGAVGACAADSFLYDPSLPWPKVLLAASCLSVKRNDGSVVGLTQGFEMKVQMDSHGEQVTRTLEQLMLRKSILE